MYGEATRSPHGLALQSRGLCGVVGLLIGPADIGGDGRRCQRHDSLSPGGGEPCSGKIRQVIHLLSPRSIVAAKVMAMKLHRTDRCEQQLRLTETAWIRAHNIAASVGWPRLTCLRFMASSI